MLGKVFLSELFPLWERGGEAQAVSASGKRRFGFSPRAQPGLCFDFAPSPPSGLGSLSSTQHPGPKYLQPTLPRLGTKRYHGGQQGTLNATHVSHQNSQRTYCVLSNGLEVEPAIVVGD